VPLFLKTSTQLAGRAMSGHGKVEAGSGDAGDIAKDFDKGLSGREGGRGLELNYPPPPSISHEPKQYT